MGFKTKYANLTDPEGFKKLLEEYQCRIIYLRRRNRVKAVVSHINGKRVAETTGMWNISKETDRMPPMVFDPEEFDTVLKNRERVDQELEDYVGRLKLPKLSLYYEDMLQDNDQVLSKIFSFLDISQFPVQGAWVKITSDNLRDVIVNFDALRNIYADTPYQAMFDEVTVVE